MHISIVMVVRYFYPKKMKLYKVSSKAYGLVVPADIIRKLNLKGGEKFVVVAELHEDGRYRIIYGSCHYDSNIARIYEDDRLISNKVELKESFRSRVSRFFDRVLEVLAIALFSPVFLAYFIIKKIRNRGFVRHLC